MNDVRDEHPSIATTRHLTAIADLWPELEANLRGGGTADDVKISRKPGAKLPIDTHVADVIHEIQAWVTYLGRILLDETTWTPPADTSTPSLLRDIAKWKVGHFTADDYDEMARAAFIEDAADMHALALRTARPSGARKIPLHVRCISHETNELGERVECPGEYYTMLIPDRAMQDMVCSEDPTHRMSPLAWQRAMKRTSSAGLARLGASLDLAVGT